MKSSLRLGALCARSREGVPCLGIVYRPQPDTAYCYRCGSHDPGVVYVQAQGPSQASRRARGRRS